MEAPVTTQFTGDVRWDARCYMTEWSHLLPVGVPALEAVTRLVGIDAVFDMLPESLSEHLSSCAECRDATSRRLHAMT